MSNRIYDGLLDLPVYALIDARVSGFRDYPNESLLVEGIMGGETEESIELKDFSFRRASIRDDLREKYGTGRFNKKYVIGVFQKKEQGTERQ
jgi:hypothetical protein